MCFYDRIQTTIFKDFLNFFMCHGTSHILALILHIIPFLLNLGKMRFSGVYVVVAGAGSRQRGRQTVLRRQGEQHRAPSVREKPQVLTLPGIEYTVQYSAVQYSTVQYSTVQYSTVQYSVKIYQIYFCNIIHMINNEHSIIHNLKLFIIEAYCIVLVVIEYLIPLGILTQASVILESIFTSLSLPMYVCLSLSIY